MKRAMNVGIIASLGAAGAYLSNCWISYRWIDITSTGYQAEGVRFGMFCAVVIAGLLGGMLTSAKD